MQQLADAREKLRQKRERMKLAQSGEETGVIVVPDNAEEPAPREEPPLAANEDNAKRTIREEPPADKGTKHNLADAILGFLVEASAMYLGMQIFQKRKCAPLINKPNGRPSHTD